jgi:hypothetical protein
VGVLRWLQRHHVVRFGLAAFVATGALLIAAATMMVGHCSAFGGRCPAVPEPWWENEVLGGVGLSTGVAVLAIGAALRPDRRGVVRAAAAAVVVGLLAGLWAVRVTSSFGWS